MADAVVGRGTHRPASLRSVASNSSVSSGVSLTRRARTKTRPKTAGSSGRADKPPESPASQLPYVDQTFARGLSRRPPSTIVSNESPPRSHANKVLAVQTDATSSHAEGRDAVADSVSESLQSPPMTPRPVRIRTSVRTARA